MIIAQKNYVGGIEVEEILKELREIKELLHVIASNTEQNTDLILEKINDSLAKAVHDTSLK